MGLPVESAVYLVVEVDVATCGECSVFSCGGWGIHMESAVYLDVEVDMATCGEDSVFSCGG